MSDNPNEQIGSARDSPPEGQDESTNLVQNNVQEARLRVNSPIPRPVSSEPRRVIGNPPTVVTVTPTTMMPPLFSFLPGLTQPRLSTPFMIENTLVARNITAETVPTDIIRTEFRYQTSLYRAEVFQLKIRYPKRKTLQRKPKFSKGNKGKEFPEIQLPTHPTESEHFLPMFLDKENL